MLDFIVLFQPSFGYFFCRQNNDGAPDQQGAGLWRGRIQRVWHTQQAAAQRGSVRTDLVPVVERLRPRPHVHRERQAGAHYGRGRWHGWQRGPRWHPGTHQSHQDVQGSSYLRLLPLKFSRCSGTIILFWRTATTPASALFVTLFNYFRFSCRG